MFWNKYFLPSFVVMVVVVALHWIGSIQNLYFAISWYDWPMHFLGGLWVVLFTLWVVNTEYGTRLLGLATFRNLILFTLLVGVLWEIHELIFRFTNLGDQGYAWDTAHDLLMDVLGGSFGTFLYRKYLRKN